ncbi:MAG: alpha/beta hydrolase domain-containing protein [Rhizobacter sp.]
MCRRLPGVGKGIVQKLLALALAAFALPALSVPNPIVTGPIQSTGTPGDAAHDYIFFATAHELAPQRYVEQEFFVEGWANRYTTPAAADAIVISSGHPYRTRVIVRRPADAKDFNGTVLVEWTNVTNGFDAENVWFFGWEHFVRAGYAWVGVSAQRVGVDRLKTWSPSRYGALDVTAGGTITDDSLSYDIYSQVGQALRSPRGVDLLGGLRPKTFVSTGESQSASRLATYANAVIPLGNVYDGMLLLSPFGSPMRTDLPLPIFKVTFEWDLETGEAAARQPDTARLHRWEVAGTAHVDHHLRLSREPLELRDLAVSSEAVLAPQCGVPNIGSRVPNHYVVDAAFDHLVRWVRSGQRPPPSPLVQIASFGPGSSAQIARDSLQQAIGGIRLSQLEVPTARNVGENSGPSACARWGYNAPLDIAALDALYPSHAAYVESALRVTAQNYRRGYILEPDARETVAEALQSRVGGHGPRSNQRLPQWDLNILDGWR